MSADRATIRMVANGVEYSFGDLDALVTQTQSYATRVQQEWRNRNAGMASSNDLAWLIRQTEILTALTQAGLDRIDQEKVETEVAMAEIDRLISEL